MAPRKLNEKRTSGPEGHTICPVNVRAVDDCKTNVRLSLFRANFEKCFVSGHDFSRAEKGQ
jgi:hypothetical protein